MTPFVLQTPISELYAAPSLVEMHQHCVTNSSISMQSDQEWRAFLNSLARPTGRFSEEHVHAVALLWDILNRNLPVRLPLPLTQPTAEGAIQMAWDAGRSFVEIDVRSDRRFEWFFRDRETNVLDGTEDEPESTISPKLMRYLRRIAFS